MYVNAHLPISEQKCTKLFFTIVYNSGRQSPGRGPVPVREAFGTGPYHFPGKIFWNIFVTLEAITYGRFMKKRELLCNCSVTWEL